MIDTKGDLGGDLTLLKLLIRGQSWEVVADNLGFADALCADAEGNFYFSRHEGAGRCIASARAMASAPRSCKEAVSGMKFGPDGLLYGCQGAKNRVISIDSEDGAVKVVASGVTPNDLAVTADGFIFITETRRQQVTRINSKTGEVDGGRYGHHASPTASRCRTTAARWPSPIPAANTSGRSASMRMASLDAKMPTMPMRLPIDPKGEFKFNEPPPYLSRSSGDGMAVDKKGRFYITSALGVQIFDPTGRPCGVLPKPKPTSRSRPASSAGRITARCTLPMGRRSISPAVDRGGSVRNQQENAAATSLKAV